MRIAAILCLPEDVGEAQSSAPGSAQLWPTFFGARPYSQLELLGQTLLDRTLAKLTRFGVCHHTIISQGASDSQTSSKSQLHAFENAVAECVNQGVELILSIDLDSYNDIDYRRLLQFHLETNNTVTQAFAKDGALGILLANASVLASAHKTRSGRFSSRVPQQQKFQYDGYVNRQNTPGAFYKLIADGLAGRCGLRPLGTETRPGLWQAPGSEIDDSVVISGPAFIGSASRVAAGCSIAAGTAIERNCEVDCGTTIKESWITQNTYLGIALDVRHSIVAQDKLFHLERNVEVKIADRDLIAEAKSAPWLAGLTSLFRGEGGRTF